MALLGGGGGGELGWGGGGLGGFGWGGCERHRPVEVDGGRGRVLPGDGALDGLLDGLPEEVDVVEAFVWWCGSSGWVGGWVGGLGASSSSLS